MTNRDLLGKVVREAWIRWASTQPNPKESWLVPYEDLSEDDKEADRQIAEAVLDDLNARRIFLAEKISRIGLLDTDADEFKALQEGVFAAIEAIHPRPKTDTAMLDELERRAAERAEPTTGRSSAPDAQTASTTTKTRTLRTMPRGARRTD